MKIHVNIDENPEKDVEETTHIQIMKVTLNSINLDNELKSFYSPETAHYLEM